MATPQTAPGIFPPSLDQVSAGERVVERFGFLYGYFGALATAAAVFAYLPGNRGWLGDPDNTLAAVVVLLTFAVPFLLCEFLRRKGRTVLVARGAEIGLYQLGRFVRALRADELLIRQRQAGGTQLSPYTVLFFPALLGLTFLLMPLYIDGTGGWLGFAVGALMLAPPISGALAYFRMTHCVIKGYKGGRDFLIGNGDMSRLRESLERAGVALRPDGR